LTPICTKSFVGWGFAPIAPDPLGELTAFVAAMYLAGLLLKGEERKGIGEGGVRPLL